jgi:hypothetical protein
MTFARQDARPGTAGNFKANLQITWARSEGGRTGSGRCRVHLRQRGRTRQTPGHRNPRLPYPEWGARESRVGVQDWLGTANVSPSSGAVATRDPVSWHRVTGSAA